MSIYGHPIPCGHGRRVPAYHWTPTALPPIRRRKRRSRRTSSARVNSPRHAADAPSLLKKAVMAVVNGCVQLLTECPESEGRIPAPVVNILGWLSLFALMASSGIGFAVGLFSFMGRFLEDFHGDAIKSCVNYCEKDDRRKCIHRKTSVDDPPSPEAVRRAWEAAQGSLMGKLWAGKLLSDLEPVVDQSFVRAEDGTIVGRRPGLKGWLRANCPDMLPHYKALMSYKALADKLRKALGIEDPDTLAGVLDFGPLAGGRTFNTGSRTEREDRADNVQTGALDSRKQTRTDDTATNDGKTPHRQNAGGRWTPKSLILRNCYKLTNTNEEKVYSCVRILFGNPMDMWTMATLDEAVREQLGICWMRRVQKPHRMA